jgi:RimJ/RimL family protein N-acetyltransferase
MEVIITDKIELIHLRQALDYINKAILNKDFKYLSSSKPFSESIILEWKKLIDEGEICVIALVNNVCVGISHIRSETGRRAVNGYLAITVDPRFWDKGIGKKMLFRIEEIAVKKGLRRITAEPCERNRRAISFLISNGYVEEGEIEHGFLEDNGDLVSRLVLGKKLNKR